MTKYPLKSAGFDIKNALNPAIGADSIQEKFMPGGPETAWKLGFVRRDASLELIQFFAFVALKVMMMLFAGQFVAGRVARYFDRLQPSFLGQRLDVSVDRGNPNAWVVLLC